MKKLLLLAAFGIVGYASAQSFQQISTTNGDYTYKYTSSCGITTTITSLDGELTFMTGLIAANIANNSLCGTNVTSVQFKSQNLD